MDVQLQQLGEQGYSLPSRKLIKNPVAIEGIQTSANITTGILDQLNEVLVAGITTSAIDKFVYDYTIERGGRPATLNFNGYRYSCCTSINDVVCHGIPDQTILKDGDIINVDISTEYKGYFSDASRMYQIGHVDKRGKDIVEITYNCLKLGIEAVTPYQPTNVIGQAIESYAMSKGYSVVTDFGGHGIGYAFHEEPFINHFITPIKGMIMVPGMVFTIEPMINEKSNTTRILKDGWTAKTIDGGLSAQWEHTILVTENGARVLT